jgi:hypothetical protein
LPLGSLRETWTKIPPPPSGADASAVQVTGTNAWVTKTPAGGFGLILTGVSRPLRLLTLKNLHLVYRGELEFEERGSKRRVSRCLQMILEPPFDTETLANIVDRLREKEPKGDFSSDLLVGTLEDVRAILEPPGPGPSKEEVIGAWGELYVLEILLRRARDPPAQHGVLEAWESQVRVRDILDFRFGAPCVVFEVKTSLGQRIHHLQGYGQVTIPEPYREGYLVSLLLEEPTDRSGRTCADVTRALRALITGTETGRERLGILLESKLGMRGAACADERYDFLTTHDSLALFPFSSVPRPTLEANVRDVTWSADLTGVQALNSAEQTAVLKRAASMAP